MSIEARNGLPVRCKQSGYALGDAAADSRCRVHRAEAKGENGGLSQASFDQVGLVLGGESKLRLQFAISSVQFVCVSTCSADILFYSEDRLGTFSGWRVDPVKLSLSVLLLNATSTICPIAVHSAVGKQDAPIPVATNWADLVPGSLHPVSLVL
ncbi:hypothetical protein ABS71_10470 [bacterium SCN 62-11]|nr:MAG: hypothetical protein ABS71_10470 [bacterium SCN 62-11]